VLHSKDEWLNATQWRTIAITLVLRNFGTYFVLRFLLFCFAHPRFAWQFCFPRGLTLKEQIPPPRLCIFALTELTGLRSYGIGLIFYQEASKDIETELASPRFVQLKTKVYVVLHFLFYFSHSIFSLLQTEKQPKKKKGSIVYLYRYALPSLWSFFRILEGNLLARVERNLQFSC
jgi:hypothetical protein